MLVVLIFPCCFAYFPLFVVLPVAAPAGVHDSDATTACFILSLFSPLVFDFCASVFPINYYFVHVATYMYTFIISSFHYLSLAIRTAM